MGNTSTAAAYAAPVITCRRGLAGHIVLNRPSALNALTREMVGLIHEQLREWATDPEVTRVVISGAGDRGLCAGGDVVGIYNDVRTHGGRGSRLFWRDEYRLNLAIAEYTKPVVALMEGIVMGGGVGLSAHASHRVVTESSTIAMPEVGIGFVPDVGGTFLLARAGYLGRYAALTGAHLRAGDAMRANLADKFVPSDRLVALMEHLSTEPVGAALARHSTTPPEPAIFDTDWIADTFSRSSVVEIVDALDASANDEARRTAGLIRSKSPTALLVTFEALDRAIGLELSKALIYEYRIACAALDSADLIEGIRAQLIDKDRDPWWRPPVLGLVTREDVEAYFAVPATGDLALSGPLGRMEMRPSSLLEFANVRRGDNSRGCVPRAADHFLATTPQMSPHRARPIAGKNSLAAR